MRIQYLTHRIHNNIYLTPSQTASAPQVTFKPDRYHYYYTLVLFDPNAVGGNRIHWLVINIPGNDIHQGEVLFSYDGPHPPKGTGIHHYCFVLLLQLAGRMILPRPPFSTRYLSMKQLYKALRSPLFLVDRQYFTSSYP